jgi:hypothetical protein
MRKELDYLRHEVDYYKDTTQEVMILRDDFLEEHGRYKLVRDVFFGESHKLLRRNHNFICST